MRRWFALFFAVFVVPVLILLCWFPSSVLILSCAGVAYHVHRGTLFPLEDEIALGKGNTMGEDMAGWLKRYGGVSDVTVTPTNLAVRVSPSSTVVLNCHPSEDGVTPSFFRRGKEYAENSEPLVLAPDQCQWTALANDGSTLVFEPVIFRDDKKGFRVTHTQRAYRQRAVTTNIVCIALGDGTLTRMNGEDIDEVTVIKKVDGRSFLGSFLWLAPAIRATGITFRLHSLGFSVEQDGKMRPWTLEDMRTGEGWFLAPGREARIAYGDKKHAYELAFTPVSFKNHLKGFQVTAIDDGSASGYNVVTNTAYIALSDTPVLVGAIDVEGVDVRTVIQREKKRPGIQEKEITDIIRFLGSHGWADISMTSAGLAFTFNPSDKVDVIVEQGGVRTAGRTLAVKS